MFKKLVKQKILCIGNFISRPSAQSTVSYMKNLIPDDSHEYQHFVHHVEQYNINIDEYKCLLARSTLPNRYILLPEAKNLLTSSPKHREDCVQNKNLVEP